MEGTTKTELTAAIADETGLTRKQAAAALDTALHLIQAALARGDNVSLIGFGTFEVHAYRSSPGDSARTGGRPAFRPGAPFRAAITTARELQHRPQETVP